MKTRTKVALVLIAIVAAMGWAAWEATRNRLTVENRSGRTIVQVHIKIGGKTTAFHDLPPASKTASDFPILSDDHLALKGTLDDGTEFQGQFGYVTNGMYGERASFIIRQGGDVDFRKVHAFN